ncbi:MAG: alpha/beta hydrolase [Myxococcales bacterium]|nr:alpha/beta hydrolase [Myxococcales bacterium]
MTSARRVLVVLVCAAPVLFAVSAPLRRAVEAGRALERFERGVPRVARREHVVEGVRVRDFGAGPALVLVHGAHEEGIDEPRLVRLAEVLAAEGFGVRTPELPGLVALRLEPSDLDALRRSSPPGAAAFGVSVGGTYALRVAAEAPSVFSSLLVLGAPADLERTARAHLVDVEPRGQPRTVVDPRGQPRTVVDPRGQPRTVVDPRGQPRTVVDPSGRPRTAVARAHPYAHQVFATALGGVLDEASLAAARTRLARLSPEHHLAAIELPVFVLHGADDPLVPTAEADALASALPRAKCWVSPLLGHAETREVGLAERLALARFFAEAFEAFRQAGATLTVPPR